MIEDNYRKRFIEAFKKRVDIDIENKMISDYWFEIMEEKDKEIERLNNIINELEEHLIEVDKQYNKCSCYNDILQELYKLKNYKYLKDSDKE